MAESPIGSMQALLRTPGFLAVVAAGLWLLLAACGADTPRRPNVLLVVVDTLRADAVGVYGSEWGSTPFLDDFAREGIVFEEAQAPTPMTAPSHASLFTSTHPASHGIWNEVHLGPTKTVYPELPPSALTLAEVLHAEGYETAAFADGGWVVEERGFAQGFERFESVSRGVVDRVRSAMEWLDHRDDERPFFLFLHTYEVHAPYLPPVRHQRSHAGSYSGPLLEVVRRARAFAESGAVKSQYADIHERFFQPLFPQLGAADARFLRALYQAELALVDEQLAQLVAAMRRSGLLDDTLVVITSDHGEEFGEHGFYGHGQVFAEHLRIPLLIRGPGVSTGVRRDPVTLVDIMPTLLSHLGLETPAAAVGRVLDLAGAGPEPALRPLVAETLWRQRRLQSVQVGAMKAMLGYGPGSAEPLFGWVFDVSVDPGELRDISAGEAGAEFLGRSREVLRTWSEDARRHRELYFAERADREIEDFGERVEELRALGYLAE
jgi:arylsulfatase A-like enzyme